LAFVTVHGDNPAGRLHNAITSLGIHASQQPMWQAWAAALQVLGEQLPELLRQLALVHDLPAEIVSQLDRIPDAEYDRDLVMRWQGEVLGLLSTRLFGTEPAAQVVPVVTKESLFSLESCSYVLHRLSPQPMVSVEDQERIAQKVRELEEAVRAEPTMDADLRAFLLYHAGLMSRALRDLPVRGRASLEDAYDQAWGAARRRIDLTIRVKEEHPSAWEKFRDVMLVIAAILSIASTGLALPGQVLQELEGPPPATETVVKVVGQPQAQHDVPAPRASSKPVP
jgi:hypothetical protein